MNLDDAQKQQVAAWITQGLKLAEIQQRLTEEFGVRMTYMEVRLLMSELQLKPKDVLPPPVPQSDVLKNSAGTAGPAGAKGGLMKSSSKDDIDDEQDLPGGVAVAVDQITRPGSMVSGKVTFSDGNKAEWYLDQFGRLGLSSEQKGYKPSQEDLMAFQAELQNTLSGM
jgi:hypothetical protein